MKNTHVALSIYKSFLMILILIASTYLSFEFIINPLHYVSAICPNSRFIQLTGIITTIISLSFLILLTFNLLFNRDRGITINENGIFVNMNIFERQNELIEWSNIKSIERIEYYNQNLIIIYLINNDAFFTKIKNKTSLFIYKNRCKKFGSPIVVTSKALKIKDNDKLECLLNDSFKEFKTNARKL